MNIGNALVNADIRHIDNLKSDVMRLKKKLNQLKGE